MVTWTRGRANPSCWPHHTAGFTLLEVMAAMAIVAMLLIPLLRLHLLSMDAIIRSQDLTTAVLLTQGRLAAMGTFPEPGEEEGVYEEPELTKYRWQTVVTEHKFDAAAPTSGEETAASVEVRHIEVTVRWADGQHERHYSLETYASQ
ncbi:MAG: prepilin-type N-terminal cleavage/methylation domain-containing protein [bacterium]|nr:prepilin-type N-terminal cleavage/methylation domain-containing protein [bacterium]